MSRFSVRNFVVGAGKPVSVKPASLVGVGPARGWLGSAGGGSGDERGITLQTLIVTAVLVLMAVAAGVVIVAITNNSADDLEDQASDIEGRCQPWEIHDTQLAAAGLGGDTGVSFEKRYYSWLTTADNLISSGDRGRVLSSGLGCLAPCYLKSTSPVVSSESRSLDVFVRRGGAELVELVFDTSNRPPKHKLNEGGRIVEGEHRLGVEYLRETKYHEKTFRRSDGSFGAVRVNWDYDRRVLSPDVRTSSFGYHAWATAFEEGGFVLAVGLRPPSYNGADVDVPLRYRSKSAVRVNAQQDGCVIYNTENDAICLDSTKPEGQQYTDCGIR